MKKIIVKNKNLITAFMIIFITLFCAGCASVDYSRFIYPTGEITDKIVIELDSKKITESGFSVAFVAEEIKKDLENYYVFSVRRFIETYCANDEHSLEQQLLVRTGIKSNAEIVDNSKIYAEINFASSDMFNLYYGISNDDEDSGELEFREGSFVNKYVQSSQNAYAVLKTELLQEIINKYKILFSNKFNLNDLKLTQVYASPNQDLKSNANVTEVYKGIKMHEWDINPDNLDFNLEFYTVSPRTGVWYILALFTTILITFIIYCNIRSKKFIKQQNNPENINQSGLKK